MLTFSKWKYNVQDIQGEVLCGMYVHSSRFTIFAHKIVSQFTLLASTKKGSKPDFHGALGGEQAKALYEGMILRILDIRLTCTSTAISTSLRTEALRLANAFCSFKVFVSKVKQGYHDEMVKDGVFQAIMV